MKRTNKLLNTAIVAVIALFVSINISAAEQKMALAAQRRQEIEARYLSIKQQSDQMEAQRQQVGKAQVSTRPAAYQQLDSMLDGQTSKEAIYVNWEQVLKFIDTNKINVNDYRTKISEDPEYEMRCEYGKSLLYLAVYDNKPHVAKLLLEKYGANPTAQELPLKGSEMTLLLAKHGYHASLPVPMAKPVYSSSTTISSGSQQTRPAIYQKLDNMLDGQTSKQAIYVNWEEVLKFVDANKINVNDYRTEISEDPEYEMHCDYGKSLLYLAVYADKPDVVKLLLEKYGANPTAQRLPIDQTYNRGTSNPQITGLLSQYGYKF